MYVNLYFLSIIEINNFLIDPSTQPSEIGGVNTVFFDFKNKFEFVDSMMLLLELHNKTSSNPLLFAYLLAKIYKSELRDLIFESFDGDFKLFV